MWLEFAEKDLFFFFYHIDFILFCHVYYSAFLEVTFFALGQNLLLCVITSYSLLVFILTDLTDERRISHTLPAHVYLFLVLFLSAYYIPETLLEADDVAELIMYGLFVEIKTGRILPWSYAGG